MILNKLVIITLKAYKFFISPLLGQRCRFYPSCSMYGQEVFQKHTILRASWYLTIRLMKCHPFHGGGYDPVPTTEKSA